MTSHAETAPSPASNWRVVPAEPADVAVISAIEALCFSHDVFTPPVISAFLAAGNGRAWRVERVPAGKPVEAGDVAVNEAEAETVGHILTRFGGDEAEVLTLAVLPRARGQGLGRKLLETALTGLKQEGVNAVFFDVRPDNLPARRLYEAAGAREIGLRPGYYSDGADAVMYRLVLRG